MGVMVPQLVAENDQSVTSVCDTSGYKPVMNMEKKKRIIFKFQSVTFYLYDTPVQI